MSRVDAFADRFVQRGAVPTAGEMAFVEHLRALDDEQIARVRACWEQTMRGPAPRVEFHEWSTVNVPAAGPL